MNTSLNFNSMGGFAPQFFPYLVFAVALLQLVIALVLAFAVSADAEKRKERLFLVGPWIWFFVVLLTGGYLGAFAYWLIHFSALRYRSEAKS